MLIPPLINFQRLGLDTLLDTFSALTAEMRSRSYALLDYAATLFDRDFLAFHDNMAALETAFGHVVEAALRYLFPCFC